MQFPGVLWRSVEFGDVPWRSVEFGSRGTQIGGQGGWDAIQSTALTSGDIYFPCIHIDTLTDISGSSFLVIVHLTLLVFNRLISAYAFPC